MKYYFFRDLDNQGNLEDEKTYHAAGLVAQVFEKAESPSFSGNDLSVRFFEPFKGCVSSAWRAFSEVELFEVDEWDYFWLVDNYNDVNSVNE